MISYNCKAYANETVIDDLNYCGFEEMLNFLAEQREYHIAGRKFDKIEVTTFVDGEQKAKDCILF